MKNICTFETAAALEAAGFPQSAQEQGQVWYNIFGTPYFIVSVIAPGVFLSINMNRESICAIGTGGYYFAPTAADILRELPGMALNVFSGMDGLYFSIEEKGYYDEPRDIYTEWTGENPAEVCAAAWLGLKNKI